MLKEYCQVHHFPYPRLSVAHLVTINILGSVMHYSNKSTILPYTGTVSYLNNIICQFLWACWSYGVAAK